jgi:signal transduction histidine kinase/predicted negative regulator of RcsB-dependent stress response
MFHFNDFLITKLENDSLECNFKPKDNHSSQDSAFPQPIMSNCLLRIISFLLLTLAGGTTLIAQNNAYGIKDDLYRIFSYASDNANHVEGLEAADSMYRKAVDMSDGKSMCLALTVPLRHYSSRDNLDSLLIYVERLNQTARATGNLQYSYFAETSRIIYHLRRHSYNEAIKSVNNIWHQAFDNDTLPYGRCAAIQSLGHLYVALNDRDLAIRQYKEALGYLRKNVTDQDESGLAVRLSDLYLNQGKLDSAAVYCDIALKNARTQRIQSIALIMRSRILFERGNIEEFNRAYKHAFDRIHNHDIVSDSSTIYLFLTDKAKADGDMRIALHYATRINNPADRHDAVAKVYEYFGEYDKALDATRKSRLAVDSLRREIILEQLSILDRQVLTHAARYGYRQALDTPTDTSESSFWFILFVILTVLFAIGCVAAFMQHRHISQKFRLRIEEAENRAEESRLAIEMAERARATAYIQTAGRNMRNPLNAIVGFTQLLSDTDTYLPPELRKKYSGIVRANSNLLLALVDDITDIAELEMQLCDISLSEVCPNAIVRDSIAMFEAQSLDNGYGNIRLHFKTEIPEDYTILSDSVHLRQVLNQLLSNAEKFTNNLDGGDITIEVSLSENFGRLTIAVSDTGIGIPPSQAEAIFGKFVKLNKAVPGNGLGLCVARMIVEHLDGEIFLDTSYTGGTRFIILLPVGVDDKR